MKALTERLNSAISQTEHNRIQREQMLGEPATFMNAKRYRFLCLYTEVLSKTETLLRAIQDPSSCTTQQLTEIILERPNIVTCVSRFAKGQIRDPHFLLEEVEKIAQREAFPNSKERRPQIIDHQLAGV